MLIALSVLIIFIVAVYLVLRQPQFGSRASGKTKEKIINSPHFRNGKFHNIQFTPQLTEGGSGGKIFKEFFFKKHPHRRPEATIESVKTDLEQLDKNEDSLVWFGHSSYFMQLAGKTFLVDPVFSGHASPFTFLTRSFAGTDVYAAEDFPTIDYLVITHDHYDHMDHRTMVQLRPKVKNIITALGVGAHLQRWGYEENIIQELDWNETYSHEVGFSFHATTARHFSGRLFSRNNTLWLSLVLTTPTLNIFLGGDSGYGDHFAVIGQQFGPFDLAILECGQYNKYWKHIHLQPEEAVQAAFDLKAKKLLPVHWGKFSLSMHPWFEPIHRITKEAEKRNLPLLHPRIGELVKLKREQEFVRWWE